MLDLSLPPVLERANLPRNMIENSMFEEEPDVVDLAKDSSSSFPVRSLKDLPFLSGFLYLCEQRHVWATKEAYLQGSAEFLENTGISNSETHQSFSL